MPFAQFLLMMYLVHLGPSRDINRAKSLDHAQNRNVTE